MSPSVREHAGANEALRSRHLVSDVCCLLKHHGTGPMLLPMPIPCSLCAQSDLPEFEGWSGPLPVSLTTDSIKQHRQGIQSRSSILTALNGGPKIIESLSLPKTRILPICEPGCQPGASWSMLLPTLPLGWLADRARSGVSRSPIRRPQARHNPYHRAPQRPRVAGRPGCPSARSSWRRECGTRLRGAHAGQRHSACTAFAIAPLLPPPCSTLPAVGACFSSPRPRPSASRARTR